MFSTSLRIYLSANLVVYCLSAIFIFPEGFFIGLVALCFSLLLTSPTLGLLYLLFRMLYLKKLKPLVCWLWLVPGVIGIAFTPVVVFKMCFPEAEDVSELIVLSLACAFLGMLTQAFAIHRFFKSFHYEKEYIIENN